MHRIDVFREMMRGLGYFDVKGTMENLPENTASFEVLTDGANTIDGRLYSRYIIMVYQTYDPATPEIDKHTNIARISAALSVECGHHDIDITVEGESRDTILIVFNDLRGRLTT